VVKIAISGKARSGKDTVADLILSSFTDKYMAKHLADDPKDSKFPLPITSKFAFADPIKRIVQQMFPQTPDEILWGPSENRSKIIPGTEITYRQLLLDIGKFGRSYNPYIWVNSTVDEAEMWLNEWTPDTALAVISDVRFKNEYYRLKSEDYFLIRVRRPTNNYAAEQPKHSQDVSEIDLDDLTDSDFDHVIINDGSLEELETKVWNVPLL
jgi:hypothetical protein